MKKQPTKKVIIGDPNIIKFNTLVEKLQKEGVSSELYQDSNAFVDRLSREEYSVCVMNLLLGGIGPYEMIRIVQERSANPDIKIIILSKQIHKDNIQSAIQAGAHDFVAEPFEIDNFYHRIMYHLVPKKVIEPKGYEGPLSTGESTEWVNLLLEATEILSRTEKNQSHAAFYKILNLISVKLGSNRTSLMVVEPELNSGLVLASSDDPNFQEYPITLTKYPEVQHVLFTGNFVLIDDVAQHSLTKSLTSNVKSISIGSMMVFPVRFQNQTTGVLTIRRQNAHEVPPMQTLRILQALANTMAAHSNIRILLRRMYRDMK